MARTGTPVPAEKSPAGEPIVDFMAEAPPERPYGDAITEEHRTLLAAHGVDVPAASGADTSA